MKDKYVGYVINTLDYKENDSLLSVLCKDGLFCLRVRGAKKIASKNASSVMEYAYSEFEVNKSEKSGYLTLNEGKLLSYPSFITSNLEYLTIISFVSEGICLVDDKKDSFDCFSDCLLSMQNSQQSDLIIVAFLNFFLNKQGLALNSDECVMCGSKEGIVNFSYEDGGFLCKKCCIGGNVNIDYLRNIRILSKINFTNIGKIIKNDLDAYHYVKEVLNLIENKVGIYFKSKVFLLKVLKKEEL